MIEKIVIFDFDGTLLQTFYGDDNSYIKALSHFLPLDLNYKYWQDCYHLTDSAVLDHIYRKIENRSPYDWEVEKIKEKFLEIMFQKSQIHPHFFEEIPGASLLLQALLQKENAKVGVATGGWKSLAEFKLKHLNVPLNQLYIKGSDHHFSKFDFTQNLIEEIKTKEKVMENVSITYIGDSLYDFEMAEKAGFNFIGIDFKRAGTFEKLKLKHVLNDFTDLDFIHNLI